MTHETLRERLLDLAYGELAPREARELEAHAGSCEACRAELARLRETRRTMSALAPEPAPERGEAILLAAAREAAERRRPRRALPHWLWGTAAAAASLVAVAAVSYRLLAMRPGPLAGPDDEALLGRSPYASRAPEPAPAQPEAAAAPAEEHAAPEIAGAGDEAAPRELAVRAPAARPERRAKAAPSEERFARAEDEPRAPAARAAPAERAGSAVPPVSDEPAAERHAGRAASEVPAAEAEPLRPPPTLDAAPSASASAAAPRAQRAPPPAAAAAPSRAAAAPRALKAAAPDAALRRWAALRDAGALRSEVRTFEGCEGEAVRRIESDPEGRLVRYVREGRIAGRHLRVEHVYGADGLLACATVRDLDAPGAAVDADALGLVLPARADEAGLDAPPRCGR